MKSKNKFLTFICACIPGVGQMYYKYPKRGISLMVITFTFIALGIILYPAPLLVPVVWFFSFFDTYTIREAYEQNLSIKPDGVLFLDNSEEDFYKKLSAFYKTHKKLIAIMAIVIGTLICVESFQTFIYQAWSSESAVARFAYSIIGVLPTVAVSLLLILAGVFIIKYPNGKENEQDFTSYQLSQDTDVDVHLDIEEKLEKIAPLAEVDKYIEEDEYEYVEEYDEQEAQNYEEIPLEMPLDDKAEKAARIANAIKAAQKE